MNGDDERGSANSGPASGRLICPEMIDVGRGITRAVAILRLVAGYGQATESSPEYRQGNGLVKNGSALHRLHGKYYNIRWGGLEAVMSGVV